MAEADVIADREQPASRPLSTADILIAIPTFNNEGTIGPVLKAVRAALRWFPKRKAVIAQVDGGSSDSTVARARDSVEGQEPVLQVSYPLYPLHKLEVSHQSVPGKENAYRRIFLLAEELGAKACCVVGGDGLVITPDWIVSLVQPILDMNFDLAAPLYQRDKYDGLLVSGILYPAVRALFGKRIRQPAGSDFGYSRALILRCLSLDTWNTESARRDINFWVSMQAAQEDMKLCQVHLGSRPRVKLDAALDVSSILANLAGAMYSEMERTAEVWQRIRGSSPVPAFGLRFDPETDAHLTDVTPMIEMFRIGCQNLQDIWGLILPPAAMLELKRMSRQSGHEFHYPAELWARTVYDFAVAHRLRPIGRDHLLRALTPLYLGWIASFMVRVAEMSAGQAEEQIEKLCEAYESQKSYLISRWRWPDRFMP